MKVSPPLFRFPIIFKHIYLFFIMLYIVTLIVTMLLIIINYCQLLHLCKFKILSSTVHILREDGSKAPQQELGRIAIKLPLPPGCMSTLYQANERFKEVYFSTFPVSRLIKKR